MAEFSEDDLSRILGNDPVATSVRIRIRQDEQAINSLTLGYRAARQEIEGMVKALEKSGLLTGKLTETLAKITGAAGMGSVGSTTVAGSRPIQTTPLDRGVGTNVSSRNAAGQAGQQATGGTPQTPGTIQMTPLDKGVQTSTTIGQRLKQAVINYGAGGAQPPGPPTTVGGAIAQAAVPAANTIFAATGDRIDRNRAYSLQADRITMVFQQMKGMSQRAVQDVYRDPLTKYKLGAGGINEVLAMEAMTGLRASTMAPAIESMRAQSGFSMTAGQATGMIQNMASPEVVNRMFMMTGTALIGPGGVQNDPTKVMQQVVQRAGLTNPDLVRNAALPGSVTRANLTQMGVTGAMQDQYIQYAQMNLAYQNKGGKGMYDPGNKQHQKLMGTSGNFAMQAEETERRRGEREENFYSRQADNFADLEKSIQKVIATMGKLEDKMSSFFGLQIESSWMKGLLGPGGSMAAGAVGKAFAPAARSIGGLFSSLGKGLSWMTGGLIGDDVPVMTKSTLNRMSTTPAKRPAGLTGSADTMARKLTPAASKPATGGTQTGTAGLRMLGPQVPSSRKLGITTNTKSSVKSTPTAKPRTMLSRPLTDAEMDEGWAMIAGGDSYSAIKREATMAFTKVLYGNQTMTLAELSRLPVLANANPMAIRQFQDAAIAANRENRVIGLSSGWRSPEQQKAMFLDRHTPVSYKTDIEYDGQYWVLNPGEAPAAVPGAAWSNHEHGLAFDVVGDTEWLYQNRTKFNFENFRDVNNEPWHFQVAGTRTPGSGGGAGFNQRMGFTPPGIRLGQDGYDMSGDITEAGIIQTLYDAGIRTVKWNKNVNGQSTPIGIDFKPVRTKDSSGNVFIEFLKKESRPGTSSFRGSADAMERWLSGGKQGTPPVNQSKELLNSLSGGTQKYQTGVPGSQEDYVSFDDAARMMKDMGMTGDEIVQALAIMGRESGGNRFALNPVNEHSVGLFQINMNTPNAAQNLKDWGLSSINDLTDPRNNIKVLVEHLRWNADHGKHPFYNWGPYKGMPHLYGTSSFFDKALTTAKNLGYVQTYTGPMPTGDDVPKEMTLRKTRPTSDTSLRPVSPPKVDIKALREHLPISSPMGGVNAPSRGMDTPGVISAPSTNNNITISPSITISTNGSSVEQELEGLARKVAGMLEKEVNRVMLRRT